MIIVMVGISGSGKSTMAEILAKRYNLPIISTDEIRAEICGDVSCQDKNGEVFKIAYARLEECAKDKGAIFDATNLSVRARKEVLKHCKENKGFKVCYCSTLSLKEATARNLARERVVPVEVIERQYKNYTYPTSDEGWDEIFEF